MSMPVRDGKQLRVHVPDREVHFLERHVHVIERPALKIITANSNQILPLPFQATQKKTIKKLAVLKPASKKITVPVVVQVIKPVRKKRIKKVANDLALLLPAHNEELIIEATIRSAIAAGQNIEDIYVVNDGSKDATRSIATKLLGKSNVLNVKHSGKALAIKKAIIKFKIESRYVWLHVADADSIFSNNYFRYYREKLDPKKYAVAVGFVQSLRGNWISTYRALTYTYSQQVTRRIQSMLGMISVFPGPITCFRTDIISQLEFGGASLTEDFDITLQVHRKKLGKIVFIPKAVNYTQDPQTLTDFCKQNMRWQRGFFQGVKKYKIGIKGQLIDVSLGFQMLQTILFLAQLFILVPLILIASNNNWLIIVAIICADIVVNGVIALFASVAAKRWMLIGALPYFYFLRYVEIVIYLIAFVEVMVLKRFQEDVIGWSTAGRRYKLTKQALSDTAH